MTDARDSTELSAPPVPPVAFETPGAARSGGSQVLQALAWTAGIAGVLLLGGGLALLNGSLDLTPFEQGQLVGRMAGAVLIGLVVRWIWTRVTKGGRVLSPWIMAVAVVVLVINLVT